MITFATSGSVVSLSFVASEPIVSIVVTIGGLPANVACNSMALSCTATRTMNGLEPDQANLVFSISYSDEAGNAGTTVTAVTDSSFVYFGKCLMIFHFICVVFLSNVSTW